MLARAIGKGTRLPPWHSIALKHEGLHTRIVVIVEDGVSKQQLEELIERLAQSTGAEEIGYTDFYELLTAGHSLGYWSTHSGSHLREKNWSNRPGQEDVDMWSEYMQAEEAPLVDSPSPGDDAEEKFGRMAERHKLDVEEVRRRV